MRVPLALLTLVASACQQPATQLEIDVSNLARPTADVASPSVTRVNAAEPTRGPPPPALHATATLVRTPLDPQQPDGALGSITLHVELIGAMGGELGVEFVTPDGTMYQRQVATARLAPFDTQTFDFTLPISGTWISSQALSGRWHGHLLLGANELLSESFDLNP
jgi:hypothetical protein